MRGNKSLNELNSCSFERNGMHESHAVHADRARPSARPAKVPQSCKSHSAVPVDERPENLQRVLAPAHRHLGGVHAVQVAGAVLALQGPVLGQALVPPPVVQRVHCPQVPESARHTVEGGITGADSSGLLSDGCSPSAKLRQHGLHRIATVWSPVHRGVVAPLGDALPRYPVVRFPPCYHL
jgi:hypothetical protein